MLITTVVAVPAARTAQAASALETTELSSSAPRTTTAGDTRGSSPAVPDSHLNTVYRTLKQRSVRRL